MVINHIKSCTSGFPSHRNVSIHTSWFWLLPRNQSSHPYLLEGLNVSSQKVAILISLDDNPPQSWVDQVTSTLLYTLNHSGWWSSFSLASATRLIQPHASLKFLKRKVFLTASRPSTIVQLASSKGFKVDSRSPAVSFCDGLRLVVISRTWTTVEAGNLDTSHKLEAECSAKWSVLVAVVGSSLAATLISLNFRRDRQRSRGRGGKAQRFAAGCLCSTTTI